ncbi:E3 ubiquitin-protein ligase MARCH5 [Grifola frondosa]|uniref:E3 ubiquitin-protein ligase MARCH5 n=1 Tax=Grifola frondosa TaxID=5627 RepID=A0A1C7MF31_GRIFR|nr:E3 ubiquitin-protein ligase MARCH5 [Grifola frondosa]
MSEPWVPTVDDLRVKLCYICREEERFDNPSEPRKAWTHPCSCTLVAHESCLLHWIRAAQKDRWAPGAKNALKCPQCGTAYELESQNPWILRALNTVNRNLSTIGTLSVFAGIIFTAGAGVYIIFTSYGAYAIKEFFGEEMYNLILTDDFTLWPYHAWLNLPLIPMSLILSRMGVHHTLPLFLPWTSSPAVASPANLMAARWDPYRSKTDPLSHPQALLTWPPSPIMVTILYPVLRSAYARSYARVKSWVTGVEPKPTDEFVRRMALGFNENGEFEIGVVRDPARRRRNAPAQQQDENREEEAQGAAAPAPAEGEGDDEPGAVAEGMLRSSVGRVLSGALTIPTISRRMGSLLFRLAQHSRLLHRFLAIRPPLRAGIAPPLKFFDFTLSDQMSRVAQVGLGLRVATNVLFGGTRIWSECDPVWWRNSVGYGIFVVIKDCLKLIHLWLSRREIESRHIKSRSFAGVDIKELDLISPPPS